MLPSRVRRVLRPQIRDAKGVGVLVCDHARGLIEDNDVSSNSRAGVAILSGGKPKIELKVEEMRGVGKVEGYVLDQAEEIQQVLRALRELDEAKQVCRPALQVA